MNRTLSLQQRKNLIPKFLLGIFFFGLFFSLNAADVEAAPIKILSNSAHASGSISGTITQLLGRAFTAAEFVIHNTDATGTTYAGSSANAALSATSRYDQSGVLVPSQAPYNLYTSSWTGNPGDSTSEYNLSATYDLANNYAYSASPAMLSTTLPPTFFISPGILSYPSGYGVEWRLDETIFCSSSLSCLTAANAGMMAVLRFNHPTWNWFDVKAALRQTGVNWATGYDRTTYGFGQVNYTTANALTDGQILLQPPAAWVSTSTGRISFTVYPFKQTRRVKEVLFQFPSAPTFNAGELTLSAITALGGTKIIENTSITATTSSPFFTAVTGAYYLWFTADNATDSAANFSRVDTYSVLGPASQSEVQFNSAFNISSPVNNAISSTQSPTFTWGAADSYLGITKYQLFVDGVLNKDNITGTSSTPTSDISAGMHTWYVKAFNGGGAATTTTSTPTINIIPGYASGFTFYVDNVLGNDSNPGTQALPLATLSRAASLAAAGDTVVIVKNASVPYREMLYPANSGTSGSRITYRGVDLNNKPEIWGSADISSGWSVYGGGNPDTYQYATSTSIKVLAAGPSITTLTKKTLGTAAATLNPGEWFWVSNILYYRLAAGETMGSLHIEASMRGYGILDNTASYTSFQDIIVRYANSTGIYLSATGSIVQRAEVYESQAGVLIAGANNTIQYSVSARNRGYGINVSFPINATLSNSVIYGNTTGGLRVGTLSQAIGVIKNNIIAGNGGYSASFNFLNPPASFTATYNILDTAGDSYWNTYKGTNNFELVDPLFVATSTSNFALQQFSPAIDAGTTVAGLTTDILNNPLYGTPDIGAYEYQRPYSIGAQKISSGGLVRLYADGGYRYTAATSSDPIADLGITPVGGFSGGNTAEWMNVTVSMWQTTSPYNKQWTESSSIATSTVHTIGDFAPDSYYKISLDGTQYEILKSDAGGRLNFTYSAGYSTHTFLVEPAIIGNGPPSIIGNPDTSSYSIPGALPTPDTPSSVIVIPTPAAIENNLPPATTTISILAATTTTIVSTTTTSQIITSEKKLEAPLFTRTLKRGTKGSDVSALQKLLKKDSSIYPEGIVNGSFGPATERAVQRFQKKFNLVSSGTPQTTGYGAVGPKTRAYIVKK